MEVRIFIDDRIVRGARAVGALVTRRNLTCLLTLGLATTGLVALAAPADKPHEFSAGTPIVAAEGNENFDTIHEAFNGHVIRTDQTLSVAVTDGCDGLLGALAGLDEVRISPSATVTIELEAGTYSCSETASVRHPDGQQLRIVGGGASSADVTLQFPADVTGIRVRGQSLGRVQNLTLVGGDGTAGNGISAEQGARVSVVGVITRDFANGISATQGSTLSGQDVESRSNTRDGIQAARGSVVVLENATTASNGNDGFSSIVASSMTLVGTVEARGNAQAGLAALSEGSSSWRASHPPEIPTGSLRATGD
ncbi:MAG: hypothetical protein PVI30_17210 [Myxococcales bacterium]